MREKSGKLLWAFGEVTSAMWTVGSFILDLGDVATSVDLRVSALFGFVVFAFLVILHLASLSNRLDSRIPNISILKKEGVINPYTNDVPLFRQRPTAFTESGIVKSENRCRMTHIYFTNRPKYPTDLNHANNVSASITFFTDDGQVGPVFARWMGSEQPSNVEYGEREGLRNDRIPSNGDKKGIDLVFKFLDEEDCYIWNNDSYLADDWKPDGHKLRGSQIKARVVLKGEYLKEKRFELILHNEGKAGDIWAEVAPTAGKRLLKRIRKNGKRNRN